MNKIEPVDFHTKIWPLIYTRSFTFLSKGFYIFFSNLLLKEHSCWQNDDDAKAGQHHYILQPQHDHWPAISGHKREEEKYKDTQSHDHQMRFPSNFHNDVHAKSHQQKENQRTHTHKNEDEYIISDKASHMCHHPCLWHKRTRRCETSSRKKVAHKTTSQRMASQRRRRSGSDEYNNNVGHKEWNYANQSRQWNWNFSMQASKRKERATTRMQANTAQKVHQKNMHAYLYRFQRWKCKKWIRNHFFKWQGKNLQFHVKALLIRRKYAFCLKNAPKASLQ